MSSLAGFFHGTDDLLRGRGPEGPPGRAAARLLLILILFGALYGATMGSFGGIGDGRLLQVLYSALKVPMLLLISFGLSLPSFFVLNTLLGTRGDFPRVLGALVEAQAGLTLVLASMAPLTAFWYVSDADYDAALMFNTAMFALASFAAQRMLRRSYRPLIAINPRHRTLLRLWLLIYAFVGIQMGWVLRPFVGAPNVPVTFFRAGAWGNAYVEVARTFLRAIGF